MAEQPVQETPIEQEAPPPADMSEEEAVAFLDSLTEPQEETPQPEPPKEVTPSDEPEAKAEETEEKDEVKEPDEDEAPDEESTPDTEGEEVEAEAEGEEEELPAYDPPQTLDREDRALFKELPREAQRRWIELEQRAENRMRRSQSEADEKQRALEAELKAAQEARQRYEGALPNVLSALNARFQQEFPDIRTHDDVARMASQDPSRYIKWDALVKQHQAAEADKQASEQQRRQEAQHQFSRYIQEQDAKFIEAFPDWGSPEKAPELQKQAMELLEDVGFTKEEIEAAWQYGQPLSARDRRFQAIVAELTELRAKYRKAQTALTRTKKAKPSQPVVRPGTQSTKAEKSSVEVDELRERLKKSNRVEDAVALLSLDQ